MCRITGFLDLQYKGSYNIEEITTSMRDTLIYGGPDDAGLYIDKRDNILAFGHRRLSILDLSLSGHQPMKHDNLVIVYNGEIYNFKEIRKELEREGYIFLSNTDTEVVLKAFHRWGYSSVNKFRGMWVFAIWDNRDRKLILCRDRVGVKPLYWYFKDGLFMFSSEIKAFHKHPKFIKEIDMSALSLYLQYGYISAPHSIFKNTYKLKPGHLLIIDKQGNIKKEQYWNINNYFINRHHRNDPWLEKKEEDILIELEDILTESFKLRMVSDVPVGIFLSGGIDSSLVVALLQKEYSNPLKTFTIGFNENKYNEANWAKKVAKHLGTDHTELYCTSKEAFEIIYNLPDLYDEPFGDSSAIPTFLVSKLAKQQVKVSLSADGGDEQFYGYDRYWRYKNIIEKCEQIKKIKLLSYTLNRISPEFASNIYKIFSFMLQTRLDFKESYSKIQKLLQMEEFIEKYDLLLKIFSYNSLKNLGINEVINQNKNITKQINSYSQMMYYDLNSYLPDDILVKLDRATMGVSLEGREPFLDNKILEYSSQMPIEYKYKNNTSKYILRKILSKYIPEEYINRPKMGFGIPRSEWFKHELKELFIQHLNKREIEKAGLFNPSYIHDLLNFYFNGVDINYNKLWFLLIFEMWRKKWLN